MSRVTNYVQRIAKGKSASQLRASAKLHTRAAEQSYALFTHREMSGDIHGASEAHKEAVYLDEVAMLLDETADHLVQTQPNS